MVGFCRLCAVECEDNVLVAINIDVRQQLSIVCRVDISENDRLPKVACRECLWMMKTVFLFYTQVRNSQISLEETLANLDDAEMEIKEEQEEQQYAVELLEDEREEAVEPQEVDVETPLEEIKQEEEEEEFLDLKSEDEGNIVICKLSGSGGFSGASASLPCTRSHSQAATNVVLKPQSSDLKSHLPTLSIYPFKCSICACSFARQNYLTAHMRRHTGERPYECPMCDNAFTDRSSLTTHMRRHTGERPYKCDTCDAEFRQQNQLKVHIRWHTGERPYKCSICGQAFAAPNHLKTHMNRHTGDRPFKCSVCDATFSDRSILRNHMLRHRNEHPFKCAICDSAFEDASSLIQHSLKRHQ